MRHAIAIWFQLRRLRVGFSGFQAPGLTWQNGNAGMVFCSTTWKAARSAFHRALASVRDHPVNSEASGRKTLFKAPKLAEFFLAVCSRIAPLIELDLLHIEGVARIPSSFALTRGHRLRRHHLQTVAAQGIEKWGRGDDVLGVPHARLAHLAIVERTDDQRRPDGRALSLVVSHQTELHGTGWPPSLDDDPELISTGMTPMQRMHATHHCAPDCR